MNAKSGLPRISLANLPPADSKLNKISGKRIHTPQKLFTMYGHLPDKQEKAIIIILEQAKLMGYEWIL